MNLNRRLVRRLVAPALFIGFTMVGFGAVPAQAAEPGLGALSRQGLLAELKSAGVKVGLDRRRGVARYVGAKRYAPIQVPGVSPGAAPTFNAMVNAEKFGQLFGLSNPRTELRLRKEGRNAAGGGKVHYQQHFNGVPVMGGELIVNMDRGGALLSMNGETGAVPKALGLTPRVEKAKAAATAVAAVAKWYKLTPADLSASTPELTIYDAQLLGPASTEPVRLVWRLEVTPHKLLPIRELVLIDAKSGGIALHFNQVDTLKNRRTYTANSTATTQATQLCGETGVAPCTSGASTNAEANFAHLYAGNTYDFYLNYHGRDSFDGAGAALISTVDYLDGSCPNAFWDGSQMIYCQGLAAADDVVAHELTHAVTDRTSNLFYYYQSGAINESLSDLWGEFVDQTNGFGTDTEAVKWLLGEDINSPLTDPPMVGAIRDMKNPPDYGQPDKMSSTDYNKGSIFDDWGGVHTNSGVNNKAVYLLTDGADFNGRTVSGLGISKVAKIYYEAQTNLLTSGANYQDLAEALNQACSNLLVLGTVGITTSDCDQVQAAIAAVEMDQPPAADFAPQAQVCAAGQVVDDAFFDNLEGGLGNWTRTAGVGTQTWLGFYDFYGASYATSGRESLLGENGAAISDQRATIAVTVPTGQPYLHFRHSFFFEQSDGNNWDGGVLEYSTNNGVNWNDALAHFDSGRNYGGSVYTGVGGDNPLAGRTAFVNNSHGYVSTRLNLAPLVGLNVKFRWRVGTDSTVGAWGWWLDDVRVYTCKNNALPLANAGADQTVARGAAVTLNGQSSSDADGSITSYAWTQTAGPAVVLQNDTTATPIFTAPANLGTLSFQLTVTDNLGGATSDTMTVTVANAPPIAEAGPAQAVALGATVQLNGGGSSDRDGTVAAYAWTQVGGLTVTILNANSATPSFVAPASATTLGFRLTVTDNEGATGTDSTTVTVGTAAAAAPAAAAPASGGGGGGGCTISRDGGSDPLLALLFLWAVAVIWRRRLTRA